MTKKSFLRIIIIGTLLITGCSSFVPDADTQRITLKYQAGEYTLLQDVNRNNVIVPAGSSVKLLVVTGDEWVKIYGYNSGDELLSSTRLLLLYLFEGDFPNEKFNQEFLDAELLKIVKLKDLSAQPKKNLKKEIKKVKK